MQKLKQNALIRHVSLVGAVTLALAAPTQARVTKIVIDETVAMPAISSKHPGDQSNIT